MWALVIPTRSSFPLDIACLAVATSSIFEAWSTVRSVFSLTSPAKSRCGADGIPWIGITPVS